MTENPDPALQIITELNKNHFQNAIHLLDQLSDSQFHQIQTNIYSIITNNYLSDYSSQLNNIHRFIALYTIKGANFLQQLSETYIIQKNTKIGLLLFIFSLQKTFYGLTFEKPIPFENQSLVKFLSSLKRAEFPIFTYTFAQLNLNWNDLIEKNACYVLENGTNELIKPNEYEALKNFAMSILDIAKSIDKSENFSFSKVITEFNEKLAKLQASISSALDAFNKFKQTKICYEQYRILYNSLCESLESEILPTIIKEIETNPQADCQNLMNNIKKDLETPDKLNIYQILIACQIYKILDSFKPDLNKVLEKLRKIKNFIEKVNVRNEISLYPSYVIKHNESNSSYISIFSDMFNKNFQIFKHRYLGSLLEHAIKSEMSADELNEAFDSYENFEQNLVQIVQSQEIFGRINLSRDDFIHKSLDSWKFQSEFLNKLDFHQIRSIILSRIDEIDGCEIEKCSICNIHNFKVVCSKCGTHVCEKCLESNHNQCPLCSSNL
ncbi:hypothetical protein TVAG_009660 [Trichomonas vaginalis G3]|uniref:RING-type domain-containing protein n=1 Tax=Trichomonas vaginalis (strain ATCC PRA-98 / G3) TaxID=412133 RepID=A2ET43_TRIV3|nr:hypothetical protein TVAGG3_0468180 [Trichomonas vaginalis G3]EAY04159.1 hypothetical protein TVAG_009660 [Trichomonas vaginalis G3]KAI5514879.1 hypothetical protein TVAGG3_0468180 [Trichomonas vaginalis G3]|eukprot:XP_001316382.1 hypothetical protein [Trichomonas vaginalis G3]